MNRSAPAACTILLLALACEKTQVTYSECRVPCYTGPTDTQGHGVCRSGRPICDDEGYRIACEDEVLPSDEVCNGLDDDCNGTVDDSPADIRDLADSTCGPPPMGQCQPARFACLEGEIRCIGPDGTSVEQCNSIDDDCNGHVDDLPLGEFCYDGPQETLAHAPCRAGVMACLEGAWRCAYQRTPEPETCNGLDDDCDGIIDNGLETGPVSLDVVFLIDRSCSMGTELPSILAVLKSLSLKHEGDENFRWAIVSVPSNETNRVPSVFLDFVPSRDLRLLASGVLSDAGGNEPTWDAPYAVALGELALSFRPGAAVIQIEFTDEGGQSYRGITEADVASELSRARHRFFAFVFPHFAADFDDISSATGGRVFELRDTVDMIRDIDTVLLGCSQ